MRRSLVLKVFTLMLAFCISLNVCASPMLTPHKDNIFYDIQEAFDKAPPIEVPKEPEPIPPELMPDEELSPEELQQYIEGVLAENPELRLDPVTTSLAVKGALSFGAICYMWYSTSMISNTYSEELAAADQWIYDKWDEISQYFQGLPAKTKATFTRMMGNFSDDDLKKTYPELTPTEIASIEIPQNISSSYLKYMPGFMDSVKALIVGDMRSRTPQGQPPQPSDTFYRVLNMNHNYGTGVKIPSSVNEFFPTDQPYGIAYAAQLKTYNYGWEYVDLGIYYRIPKTSGGDLTLKIGYISRLSPNQQYDGRLYPNIDYGKSSQAVNVMIYDDATTHLSNTLYGRYDNGTLINGNIPGIVRGIIEKQCGFSPIVDDTLWHSWIDFCPLPNDIVITTGMAPVRNVYQRNGYAFQIRIVPPRDIPLTDITRSDIPNGILNIPIDRPELILDKNDVVEVPHNEELLPIPPIDPLPNPVDKPLPPDPPIDPDPNPDIPKGFFEFITAWMNKVWNWMQAFFSTLWKGFIDAMTSLFIPADGFMTDSFNQFKDEIGAAFGYINWEQFEMLSNLGEKKPNFTITVYGKDVNLIDLSFWDQYRKVIQGLIIAVVGFLLFLYNIRMVQWLIRAADSQHQSNNVNNSDRATKGGKFKA